MTPRKILAVLTVMVMTILTTLTLQCVRPSLVAQRTTRQIFIRPDLPIEVVDWGGKGRSMVFLAGLGHTAHVFDEFAPRFADDFRVLGITRRGFGASSQTDTGYCIDTLVNDIQIVLDSMGLKEVVLVGHSLGGDELTKLATHDNDRLKALVYLDAAYAQVTTRDSLDRYPVPDIPTPGPTSDEKSSPEAYGRYYERVNGVQMPLSEIQAMYNWNEKGRYIGSKTPGRIFHQIQQSLTDQFYDSIALPALALYGVDYPIEELFLDFAKTDPADRAQMVAYYEASKRLGALSRQRFREQMRNGKIVEIPGAGHSLYITHADRVENEMRLFLKNIR